MSSSAVDAGGTTALAALVKALPDLYQPIYGHPEFSDGASRRCDDRLAHVVAVCDAMHAMLQRPARVLDLGCAQGFFSLNLAARGAVVHGIDYLEENIAVCRKLAEEHGDVQSSFETANIVDMLQQLEPGRYDLVLGLSVLHHIVHDRGAPHVRDMLSNLGGKTLACLFEMALIGEPLCWAPSQPNSPRELLSGFDFVHEVARHETHLSPLRRPLYFASNRCWFVDGKAGAFTAWSRASNEMGSNTHADTRRFFFGEDRIIKLFRLDNDSYRERNLLEWGNEVSFLKKPPSDYLVPRLAAHGRNDAEAWIARECLPGNRLDKYIAAGAAYDPHRVVRDVLSQLVALERVGLYHDDVRTWNVLIDPQGHATLIDYGAISQRRSDCVWPHDIFLSFIIFMREVIDGAQERPVPLRPSWFNPDTLPQPYRGAVWAMLDSPVGERRFADLLENVERRQSNDSNAVPDRQSGLMVLLQATEEASRLYREHIDRLEGYWRASDDARSALSQVLDAVRAEAAAARAEAAAASQAAAAARVEAELVQGRLTAVLHSTSWHVTAPLRRVKFVMNWLGTGASAWILLKPGSRPRRMVQRFVAVFAGSRAGAHCS
jgi:O-antigen chain-terminating bifunctional methyltransferase/kinase